MRESLSILLLNQSWFAQCLRDQGHHVLSLGWKGSDTDHLFDTPGQHIQELLSSIKPFVPDVLLYLDDSRPVGVLGLEELDIPTIYYSVDAHHHATWQRYFSAAFDLTLIAQRNYVDEFIPFAPDTKWFPLWMPRQLDPKPERPIDVCFRGNLDRDLHPKRAEFFDRLCALVPVDAQTGKYWEVYPSSRIVINQSVKDDLNFRTFEAMASGAMLLTQSDSGGLLELFQDGQDLVTYRPDDAEDAAQKIRYYLEHEEQRAAIAASGLQKVNNHHSEQARCLELLEAIERLLQVSPRIRPRKNFGMAGALLNTAVICRKGPVMLVDKILFKAVESLEKSLQKGETIDSHFETVSIGCKFYLEDLGYATTSMKFIQKLSTSCNSSELLAVALLDSYIRRSKHVQAEAFAHERFVEPQAALQSAPRLMDQVRSALFA